MTQSFRDARLTERRNARSQGIDVATPREPCYTPQQVRFTDRRGVLWTVRCAHRLTTVREADL